MLNEETCWNAVVKKDKTQDGNFYFGVLTTGIYCRPGCGSRRPQRRNVRFYETREAAERAGLRPCQRCRPQAADSISPNMERIRKLCDYIRAQSGTGQSLALDRLSEKVGLSRFHLQRTFKKIVGVTPKQFADACRMEALKQGLRTQDSVTGAIYEAGFNSSSRVYERVDTRLGMTPSEYRTGGKGTTISYTSFESPLGRMLVAATDRGICSIQFGESHAELAASLRREFPAADVEEVKTPYSTPLENWIQALLSYLQRAQSGLEIPLDIRGTAFQLNVWNYLQSIPTGEVQSYAEVAEALGSKRGARAIAKACAANRLALVIPCHRVIRSNGELGGYRWGLDRKRVLLNNERAAQAAARALSG